MSNISNGDVGSFSSSGNTAAAQHNNSSSSNPSFLVSASSTISNGSSANPPPPPASANNKKKRNLPGTPDPNAEVITLSPTSLMATNRFVCEICNKGFQRDQNLQLHRRGHNLPWKLKQRSTAEVRKRVYVCPEPSCVHHNPARALGDLTGIKKHFSRKHGEKKWKCERCSKKYAVQSDWKAHSKTCGTREYKCDCGTIFSRRDSFITHRAFCDALTEENSKIIINHQTGPPPNAAGSNAPSRAPQHRLDLSPSPSLPSSNGHNPSSTAPECVHSETQTPFLPNFQNGSFKLNGNVYSLKNTNTIGNLLGSSPSFAGIGNGSSNQLPGSGHMSATALLQKAAQMGATASLSSPLMQPSCGTKMASSMSSSMEEIQKLGGSYEHQVQAQNGWSQVTRPTMGGYDDQSVQKGDQQPEISSELLDISNGSDMGMFNRLLFDQSGLLPRNVEHENDHIGLFVGSGKETTTVDFLGIGGGMGGPGNLEEHQKEILQLRGFHNQQKTIGLSQFHRQENGMEEKTMWWEA